MWKGGGKQGKVREYVPPSAWSIISRTSKLPPVSNAASFPCFATNSRRGSEAAFNISAARTESSFLLVWALVASVSANVAICAGVKCRRLRGAIKYSNDRRPCVDFQIAEAAAVSSETRDLDTSFVSLGDVTSIGRIHGEREGKWLTRLCRKRRKEPTEQTLLGSCVPRRV
jgi:hypothetical protein